MPEVSTTSTGPQFGPAFKDAAATAAISFLLFLPLIGFITVQDIRNVLVLDTRWSLLFIVVALITGGRLAYTLVLLPRSARRAHRGPSPRATVPFFA